MIVIGRQNSRSARGQFGKAFYHRHHWRCAAGCCSGDGRSSYHGCSVQLLTSWISRRAAGVQQPAGARGQNCPQTHQKGWSFGFRAQGRGSLTYPLKTLKASLAPREHRGQFRNMLLAPNLSVLWSAVLHAHPLRMRVIQHWELVGVFVKLQPRLT